MLNLFRPINLAIIVLTQGMVAFFLLDVPLSFPQCIPYLLLALSTSCLAAGGYVVNDIYDQVIDSINKPQKQLVGVRISAKKAWQFYTILSASSLISSGLLGTKLLIIHTLTGILLYLYAAYFKKIALLGNVLIAFLSAISAILPLEIFRGHVAYEVLPETITKPFLFLACYSFLISLIREIAKTVQDMEGDKQGNCRTFPILFGVQMSKKLITMLWVVLAILNIIYRTTVNEKITLTENPPSLLVYLQYYLLFVMLASSTLTVVMWRMKEEKEFAYISLGCKLLLVSGVLAIPLFKYL